MSEGNVSVLLVEDSASDASLLVETLRETAGDLFQVTVLERLDEALRRLKANSFDVLLLDLSLPDSAGVETFRAARAGAPHVPIILLTGVDDEAVGVEAMRQGIQDYLVKGRADGRQIARAIRYAIERKRNEEALRRMEERLRQTQKLESLGVLAGGIAHDFNNLLTITLGHTELALAEAPADSPARLHLQRILESTQRAAELSRQMLAYSGRQPLALAPLGLSGLVKKASRMLEVSISRKVRLSYRLAEDLPPVLGDAAQMSQAIMNLVLNASEAIGEREGTITLATRTLRCDRAALDAVQMDRLLPEGLYVCLEVSDTGCGMDRQTVAKAFDPFFTTKFVGRGLGLAVVQGIVRGHKGTIMVESEPGKGATFRILLPPAPVPSRIERPQAPAPGRSGAGGTVLFAEDEEAVRELGTLLLNRLGFSVLLAANGREAVELFQAHRHEIVCAMLDLAMPILDGAEALRELRRLQPNLRVIICSGYDEQRVGTQLKGLGAVTFLQKPYQIADLSDKLQALLFPAD
jgi:two-component system, cell cycle sensor histidine kinase and response regulator CckA